MRLGVVMREFRLREGLSQRALAVRLGVSADYVRLIEVDRFRPNLSFVEKLARVMETDPLVLVGQIWPTQSDEEERDAA